eukprot:TRINITY_DN4571_c0_g1_i1.p1 TRINITY_DN4571_c0_g1~~TRINITY_DN4571_c0_g1_i1.p1  ORF type:complete len:850 (-),score=160.48 TRINITY_DN4571_c0_g1_i1:118-2667(-)
MSTEQTQQQQSFFLPEHPSFEKFSQELFSLLMDLTKLSNTLPTEEDYNYYSSFRPFKSKVSLLGSQVLSMTQNFLEYESSIVPKFTEYEDVEDVVDNFPSIVDVVDGMIERVDAFADEVNGVQSAQGTAIISKSKMISTTAKSGDREYNLFYSSTLHRPQLKFSDPPDNSNQSFVPKLKHKPNALVPIEDYYAQVKTRHPQDKFPHPYEYEIDNFVYPTRMLVPRTEILYKSLDETRLTWIDTPEDLHSLANILNKETEFAVDLENHNYRSFQGFVCLMQISTRSEDYIIDTLKLREYMNVLNQSFTNPAITKVLHGSDSDVVWLQRDFGIYIVNMFDTGQAARFLEFPSASLAHSLHHFCNIQVDKKYQLADWRIRPIPEEMLKYAREDTHYLLYVYDRFHKELLSRGKNFLLSVLNRCRELCKRRYEKELTENSFADLLNRKKLNFQPQQLAAFRALYEWRDNVARTEDESTGYVLPNHMMIRIAATLPTDVNSLLNCCSSVPPQLSLNTTDVLLSIREAITNPNPQKVEWKVPRSSRDQQSAYETPRASQSRRDDHSYKEPSPVLSVEQLFPYAGWLDAKPERRETRSACLSPAKFTPRLFADDNAVQSMPLVQNSKLLLEQIRNSFIGSSLLPLLNPTPGSASTFETFVKEYENGSNQQSNSRKDVGAPSKSSAPQSSLEVPRSIDEIYKLSNKNRKRNKEKKKLKESAKKGTTGVDEDGSEEEDNEPKRQKGNSSTSEETEEFMRKIGWLGQSQPQPDLSQSQPPKTSKPNFVPFDYSAKSFGTGSNTGATGFNNSSTINEGVSNTTANAFHARTHRNKNAGKSVTSRSYEGGSGSGPGSNWRR